MSSYTGLVGGCQPAKSFLHKHKMQAEHIKVFSIKAEHASQGDVVGTQHSRLKTVDDSIGTGQVVNGCVSYRYSLPSLKTPVTNHADSVGPRQHQAVSLAVPPTTLHATRRLATCHRRAWAKLLTGYQGNAACHGLTVNCHCRLAQWYVNPLPSISSSSGCCLERY